MDKAVRAIIDAKYDKYVARCVHLMRRLPANDWNGDDSPLRTLWDHWKYEVQQSHSIMHYPIEDMVKAIAWKVVQKLSHDDGALLTLGSNASDDMDEDEGEPVFAPDAVLATLMSRINTRADNEPHRREVQRQLDAEERDRFERDMEPYR